MEGYERKSIAAARDLLPAGFGFVRTGPILDDDLVFSWTSNEWIAAKSPDWDQARPADAADCVAVARQAGLELVGATRRSYKLRTFDEPPADPGPSIATPGPALFAGVSQPKLF